LRSGSKKKKGPVCGGREGGKEGGRGGEEAEEAEETEKRREEKMIKYVQGCRPESKVQ
jgi:hypothetical protein